MLSRTYVVKGINVSISWESLPTITVVHLTFDKLELPELLRFLGPRSLGLSSSGVSTGER
jgi:hypothetical protein